MSSYYEQMTGEKFATTIDCQERRLMMIDALGLREEGRPNTLFWTPKKTLIAHGYLRVVYGDHGPYIEFLPEHMIRDAWKLW